MTTSKDASHVWISWDDYHRSIEVLAKQVFDSGWTFDHVLCLARGGLRPGDVFSRLFNVPLSILTVSSYREEGGTQRGELCIADRITSTADTLSGRLLLIDDLVDSGVTLQRVGEWLLNRHPEISEIRSAVIWYKENSSVCPDYFVHPVAGNPWIHQPFELYDQMMPDTL
jgi:hypoxanthine phosphoribosyltransferase